MYNSVDDKITLNRKYTVFKNYKQIHNKKLSKEEVFKIIEDNKQKNIINNQL